MPDVGGIAGDRLKSFIERIERLEEEKRALGSDIKEVYSEAKGAGFDTKIMRLLIKERRLDKDDRDEQETLLDLYRRALGMLVDTPLGEASLAKVTKLTDLPPLGDSHRRKRGAQKVRSAAKEFIDSVAKNPGDSVSITMPGHGGVKIANVGGEKTVEPVPA
jgi:uncharacterized protein (UPF0335 family)